MYRNLPPEADPPAADNLYSRAGNGVDSFGGHKMKPCLTPSRKAAKEYKITDDVSRTNLTFAT